MIDGVNNEKNDTDAGGYYTASVPPNKRTAIHLDIG